MRNEGGGFAAIFRETLIKSLSEQTQNDALSPQHRFARRSLPKEGALLRIGGVVGYSFRKSLIPFDCPQTKKIPRLRSE